MVTSISRSAAATRLENYLITARQLHKRYRHGTEALRGLDLAVREGDLFGLIGPDGAGKTTALNILAGVMEPTSGEVRVLGRPPRKARARIGYVTQHFSLYPELTVDENLRYEAGLYGVSEEAFARRRARYLKKMGLYDFPDRLAGQLSGGMKQKLALCCALIRQPKLLLLDEPTTGLDPVSRRELWQVLAAVAREGVTTVIATPYLEEAERCNRIGLVYEGRIQEVGAPQELQAALGLRRLEVLVSDVGRAESALSKVAARRSTNIVDIQVFGDRLTVLAKDTQDAEEEVRTLLAAEQLLPDMVQVAAPNLENVFVMRLREQGLKESLPPPLPRLRLPSEEELLQQDNGAAIHAHDLSKRFQSFQAVKKVNLSVGYGEIYGLLGANGAGKTTTIKMLCGLLAPTSGEVALVGETRNLRGREVRKRIGYMSQKFTLYEGLSVIENLEFYSSIYEIPRQKRREKISWALDACGLSGMKNALVGRLPRGWKQRIAFGASVMHEPEILFLDEPTAGVDPIARRQLWSMIRSLAQTGTAVLVTTHYLEEAEYCTRLGLMTQGEIVVQGSPGEIKNGQPGQLVEVSTGGTQNAFEALSTSFDSWRVSIFDDVVHVLLDDPERQVSQVKSVLQEAGVNVRSVRPIPFSLEDAFIAIVQRNHRDHS